MKKIFTLLLLTISIATASISTDGLTEKQKAEIALQVANIKEQSGVTTTSTVDTIVTNLSKFESIGEQTGIAVKRSLEAVVDVSNKFGDTPVGKITIALVVWRIVGSDIALLLLGIIIFSIGLFLFKRIYFERKIPTSYTNEPRLWGLYTTRVPKDYHFVESSEDSKVFAGILLLVSMIVFIVSIVNIG